MKNIFVAGPSASGKSTLSRRLANRIGFVWMDTGSVIRLTAAQMLEGGLALPQSKETVEHTIIPPWKILDVSGTGEVRISVGNEVLNYDDDRLRNPVFDTDTLYLAQALDPKIEDLQRQVCASQNSVISCRHAPPELVDSSDTLAMYLHLSAEERVARRAQFEGTVDPDRVRRIVEKEVHNILLGNLISPELAEARQYAMVRNEGSLSRSDSQLLLEVLKKYEGFEPLDYEIALEQLQAAKPELRHFSKWRELVESLDVHQHPEGYLHKREF